MKHSIHKSIIEIESKGDHIVKFKIKRKSKMEQASNIAFILILFIIFSKMLSNLEAIKVNQIPTDLIQRTQSSSTAQFLN